jgi:hypothetical protein
MHGQGMRMPQWKRAPMSVELYGELTGKTQSMSGLVPSGRFARVDDPWSRQLRVASRTGRMVAGTGVSAAGGH